MTPHRRIAAAAALALLAPLAAATQAVAQPYSGTGFQASQQLSDPPPPAPKAAPAARSANGDNQQAARSKAHARKKSGGA